MSQFEYLSVLVSIIVGLALTNLLSGGARLIHLRHRLRPHGATLCWMLVLFLLDIQVWWVAFERRDAQDWNYFSFLLYLLIPIALFLLNSLVLPDLGDEDTPDLRANFDKNRGWFFALLAALPVVSLAEQLLRDRHVPLDADTAFRGGFLLLALCGVRAHGARADRWLAGAVLALFLGYVTVLFQRLG